MARIRLDPRKLLEARAAAGLTQSQLAEAAGVQQPFICHLEADRSGVGAKVAARLAKALGKPVADLMAKEASDDDLDAAAAS